MTPIQKPITNGQLLSGIEDLEKQGENRTNEIKELKRAIYGFNGTPGILTDIIILKKMMEDVKKLAWAIVIFVIGILGTAIWDLIISHPPSP